MQIPDREKAVFEQRAANQENQAALGKQSSTHPDGPSKSNTQPSANHGLAVRNKSAIDSRALDYLSTNVRT
jgi:hypothetical protein